MNTYWSTFIVRLQFVIWLGLLSSVLANAQLSPVVSIQTQLNRSQPDSVKAQLYLRLGELYLQSDMDSALYCFQQSIALSGKLTNKWLLARGYLKLGYTYSHQANFPKSIVALQQAEQVQKALSSDSTLLEIQVNLAKTRRSMGDYPGALKQCLGMLRAYEKHPVPANRQLGLLYSELGVIYDHLKRFDLAQQYHQKRLAVSKKGTNPRDLMIAYINMCAFYESTNNLLNARNYCLHALTIVEKFNLIADYGVVLVNMADIAHKRRQFKEAIRFYKQALLQPQTKKLTGLNAWCHLMLANDYQALHHYQNALFHIERSIALYKAAQSARYTPQALAVKSKLLAATGDYRNALQINIQAQTLEDSLLGIDKQKAVAQVQASFDLERKQAQIVTLRKDLTIQKQTQHATQLQLTIAQKQRLLYLTSALLLTLLLIISYVSIRRQRAAQRLLLAQKDEIQQQALQLTELNQTKDKLFSLISHDLRSPVAHLKQNFYQLRTDKQLPTSQRESLYNLENQVDNILNLLNNLLDWSHSQLSGFQSKPQRINLTQAITEVVSQLADQLRYKDIGLINGLSEPNFVKADRHQLHSILRNLLNNAIKFTPKGGYIRLQAISKSEQVELLIQDTGIGIEAAELAQLLHSPTVRAGTQGEPSTGLGLRLIQDLLTRQGGSIAVSSQPQKGTTVRVQLPQSFSGEVVENEI